MGLSEWARSGRVGFSHRRRAAKPTGMAGRVAVVLAVTAAVAAPAQAVADPAHSASLPAAPKVASVSVHPVHGTRIALKDQTTNNRWTATPPHWPQAADGTATLLAGQAPSPKAARAGTLPVWLTPHPGTGAQSVAKPTATHVGVRMRDHAAALRAGVNGVLFTASSTGGPTGTTPASVSLDYSSFKDAYGGDWSSRLRLVQLPACALTTPGKPQCRTQTPLAHNVNDSATERVTAQVTLPQAPGATATPSATAATFPVTSGGASTTTGPAARSASTGMVVLAATSSLSGGAGDYSASPLAPSGSWVSGQSSGDFTYSYPIAVPPAAGGLTPSLSMSYDAQSVDGRLASTDNQAGWVGDGWNLEPGAVTRSYMSCSDDPAGTAPKTSDYCWAGQVLHVSFAGHSGDIVQDSSTPTGWRLSDDEGEKVELVVTNSTTQNGTYDGDYWKITTPEDGTVYYFGRGTLPTYGTTNSAWTVPVYGAHSGDPCYNATFASASCAQAWQWNLDEVVDLHGNTMVYHYTKETNYYGADNGTTGVLYTRAGYLNYIDYGLGNGNTTAPQRVTFTTGERCVATTCDPIASNTANWPDVPYDLNCAFGASCSTHAPSFWSLRRLTTITTGIYNSTSQTYPAIDTYALAQSFPSPGDNTKPALWLDSVTRTGNTGTAITLPPVKFTGQKLANRYNTGNGYPDLVRYRISGITTESGEQTAVAYNPASCDPSVAPSANVKTCFPVYWTPVGQPSPILDWFNKYLVSTVGENDATGGAPTRTTNYVYLGNPGWHYDDNEIVKAKYRTWGQWRGYPEVQTRVGSGSDTKTLTDTRYYRGMDGDTLPSNQTRTATVSLSPDVTVPGATVTVPDTAQLAGKVRESLSYNGDGGPAASATVNSYWISAATATRTRTGLPDLTANMVRSAVTVTTSAVTSGATTQWRTTQVANAYDKTSGLLEYTDDQGDITVPAQETCTSTTYAPANTSIGLYGLPAEVETDQGACATGDSTTSNGLGYPTSVSRPSAVISDTRTFYDTNPTALPAAPLAWPQAAPTKGDPTVTEQATDYTGGAFTYQVHGAIAYEAGYGRPVDSWDALGHDTHTAYTTTAGQTTGQVVTNAKAQKTTSTIDPTRGLVTSVVDPNNTSTNIVETDTAYDALGRVTSVWLPGRAKATQSANTTYAYVISTTASSVTTKQLNEDGTYTVGTQLYDALLRPRQTQTQTPAGGRLLTDTYYDTRGWVWKTNGAYWDGSTTPNTTLVSSTDPQVTNQDVTTFDGLGRPMLDVSKDKGTVVSQTRTVYGGDRTTVIPPTGGTPTTTVTDARGRTTEVDRYTSMPTVSGDQVTGGSPKATTYSYDKPGDRGKLDSLTDPGGNVRTYTYNLLGQTTDQTDPDTGHTGMTYDAAGELKSVTDGRSKTISYDYDTLGRKTGEFDGPDDTATELASWTYDDPAVANSLGRLTSSSRYVTGTGATDGTYTQDTTGYNVLGQPTGSKVSLPSTLTVFGTTSFSYSNTYTPNVKLPMTTVYPAVGTLPAETVTTTYLSMGLPLSVGGLNTYTSTSTYDAYSRVSQTTLGKLTNRNQITNQFDEHTGALAEVTSTRASDSTNVDDTQYKRDLYGNITRITDVQSAGSSTDTQCFQYDLLGRMTQAWSATDACAGAPSMASGSATVGGPNPYWTSWTFDDDGNRKTQVQHGTTAGAGDTSTAYTYGQPADHSKQPDTLTSTQVTAPDGTTGPATAYGYDAAGNTTASPTADVLNWDDEGRLQSLTGTGQTNSTSYIYDAGGSQLLRTDPSGTLTLFLPGQEITSTAGTVTGYRTIALPGGAVAERFGTGSGYSFVLDNDQGTGTVGLDNTAQLPTFREFTPYGGDRTARPATWHDDKGLVGGTTDQTTGLTNLGAREYDPITGRFLSADPVLEATDPNQIGGYTYAADNPITHSDPTGLMRDGGGDCGMTGTCNLDTSSVNGWDILSPSTQHTVERAYHRYERATAKYYSAQQIWYSENVSKLTAPRPKPQHKSVWSRTWGGVKKGAHAAYHYSGASDVVGCVSDPSVGGCSKAAAMSAGFILTGGEDELEIAAYEAGEDLAAKGASEVADDVAARVSGEGSDIFGPFHRLASSTQTVDDLQLARDSGELWGKESRVFPGEAMVKAHRGPLPDGAKPGSFEFYTGVEPNPINRTPPGYAWWKAGTPGVRSFVLDNVDWAAIPIDITRAVE